MVEIIVEANVDNLDTVLEFISAELAKTGCPVKTRTQIAVAAEEIFVNIAHYAYKPATGMAAVRVSVNGDIKIEFEDAGHKYNPLDKDDPDVTAPADEREIGGLGIYMVKNLMDDIEYRYENGKNVLFLKKGLPG
jgi:anti-sigma regulatory factor (Ser/Thr protein kinase)